MTVELTFDDLMIFADQLKPGDRSVYHGGLTVLAVRPGRRIDVLEVDFEDDDGTRHDTHFIHQTEWMHVVRPVLVDGDDLDDGPPDEDDDGPWHDEVSERW